MNFGEVRGRNPSPQLEVNCDVELWSVNYAFGYGVILDHSESDHPVAASHCSSKFMQVI